MEYDVYDGERRALKFVTLEEFEKLVEIASAHVGQTRAQALSEWFPLFLRADWATGCRPSELLGCDERMDSWVGEGRRGPSHVKPHHGLRAEDVKPNQRLFVAGKNTNPRKQMPRLKARTVLCADRQTWTQLSMRSTRLVRDGRSRANVFTDYGGAKSVQDGRGELHNEMTKFKRILKRELPEFVAFSPRWLRHSHAIHALRSGMDLVSVQRQLGHNDLMTTARYLRHAGLDNESYLRSFESQRGAMEWTARACPSCGASWREHSKTGELDLGDRVSLSFRRR